MLLRRLLTPLQLRVSRRAFSDVSTPVLATCLRDIARSGPRVVELQLSKSNDLVCRQLMCEHVGDACACRLALALERVPRLHALDLSNNQLRGLPDAVFALERLQTLDIQRNRLTTLPMDVEKLIELESLDVSYNQLKTLPVEQLETLKNLKELRVAGNEELIQAIEDQTLSMSEQLRDKIILK
ncbi:putative serine/threonine-protein kinase roco5 [Phytophthora citrophthora]|uniref:Serine/threonine-protein kinase roco5 n=1 Tax=Phytophthora citrophthora TaxID=4793 RepID=A0AAD9GMX9_9STRA|nr:putative serine/threonine-protein kinase roco5 [Phytophthora citrophthora]